MMEKAAAAFLPQHSTCYCFWILWVAYDPNDSSNSMCQCTYTLGLSRKAWLVLESCSRGSAARWWKSSWLDGVKRGHYHQGLAEYDENAFRCRSLESPILCSPAPQGHLFLYFWQEFIINKDLFFGDLLLLFGLSQKRLNLKSFPFMIFSGVDDL